MWFMPPPKKNWGQKPKNRASALQFGAYNSGKEANICMLKTAMEPEDNGLP